MDGLRGGGCSQSYRTWWGQHTRAGDELQEQRQQGQEDEEERGEEEEKDEADDVDPDEDEQEGAEALMALAGPAKVGGRSMGTCHRIQNGAPRISVDTNLRACSALPACVPALPCLPCQPQRRRAAAVRRARPTGAAA